MSAPTAREGALRLILAATENAAALNEAELPEGLTPAERARAMTLARAALRFAGSVDAVLAKLMKKSPPKEGRAILRLAGAELLALGEAEHAVVDSAVRLAKSKRKTAPLSGLVNAVSRRLASEGPAIWATLDHGRLNTPEWLWKALRADWGKAGAASISAAHLAPAPLDLTPKNGDAARLAAALGGDVTPTGSARLTRPGALTSLAGYTEGEWWAQDAAAAMPARLAGPGEGRRALDLCAAPGGKTMQLAAAGWRVTALDLSETRLARLRENLARTRLEAEIVVADALSFEAPAFDLVLLDAPCTATGTIRRHPELGHNRDGAGAQNAAALQAKLLEAAWALTAPGGTLIYATCSLIKAEGEAQINAFLKAHPEAARKPVEPAETGDRELITTAGDFRARPDFWPERGGMDGFFAARLIRGG